MFVKLKVIIDLIKLVNHVHGKINLDSIEREESDYPPRFLKVVNLNEMIFE